MRVLVTGGGGQVGQALMNSVPASVAATGLSHSDLDITDVYAVMKRVYEQRPEVIINAAAYTAVDLAEDEPDAAAWANTTGPRNLALAARQMGARLIHISTDFVFDGHSSVPYGPNSRTGPLNVYGSTKHAGEQAVLETLPNRSLVLRTGWVYAAKGNNFVRTMLRLMAATGSVRVVADQVGTPTSARSVAQAVWTIVMRSDLNGILHWSDAGVASWYDFAVAIAEEAAAVGLLPSDVRVFPLRSDEYPTRALRPSYSVLEKGLLWMQPGLEPVHWRTSLRAVVREIANA